MNKLLRKAVMSLSVGCPALVKHCFYLLDNDTRHLIAASADAISTVKRNGPQSIKVR